MSIWNLRESQLSVRPDLRAAPEAIKDSCLKGVFYPLYCSVNSSVKQVLPVLGLLPLILTLPGLGSLHVVKDNGCLWSPPAFLRLFSRTLVGVFPWHNRELSSSRFRQP